VLGDVLRGLGRLIARLIAYMLVSFICLLILMFCVGAFLGAFLKVTSPTLQGEGPEKEVREVEVVPTTTNGSYSFCFIRDGKQYYFEVLGWVKPNSTILKQYLSRMYERGCFHSRTRGLLVFLRLRTNLNWKWLLTEAECRVGELYKRCFQGSVDCAVRVNNDTLLIPYNFEVKEFWESYKIVKECYLNASAIRLYFRVYDFLGLKEGDSVKVGKITLTRERDEMGIYVEYPRPDFSVSIEGVKYLGYEGGYHLLNATLRLEGVGMVVEYSFDKFGRKARLSEEFIPVYALTVETTSSKETWIAGRFNETHYLVAVPTATGHVFAVRYFFGGGFEDVWKEPQHRYVASYASSGEKIWLKMRIYYKYVVGETLALVTPWGQMYEVRVSTED